MCIPFLFKPVENENKMWVDGGCMNDYPIDLFVDDLDNVIGICFENDKNYVENFQYHTYIYRVIKCLSNSQNINKLNIYKKCTIKITSNVNMVEEFNISQNIKKQLFNNGFNTTKKFFK